MQFQKWSDDAMVAGLKEPNAMALSTTGKPGGGTRYWKFGIVVFSGKSRAPLDHWDFCSSRIVLLKGFDKDGFSGTPIMKAERGVTK
ncbi:hypothetical protein HAX54_028063 [Datura stramonium]|uniref:Uncharacterized protein n=1 Tax=Datura stramonium TaxID=4076 RepID=A0ABS8S998_DATST|nr:hypothetical protein [Datura stramonium]